MEKVKVTQEVAEVLTFKLAKFGADMTMTNHAHGFDDVGNLVEGREWTREASVLNSLSVGDMAKALYIGYEVEKTPEQELTEIYRYYRHEAYTTDMSTYADGIVRALDTLGIKIEGVDA